MNYSVLCGYFNSTKIILNRSELLVTRGPLPCRGNRRLSVDQIQQIDSERAYVASSGDPGVMVRGYSYPGGIIPGGQRRRRMLFLLPGKFEMSYGWIYSLNARMTDGSVVQLLGLRTSNVAEFLQFTLEQKLRTLRSAPVNTSIEG
jgi:hypothetical protein